MRDKPCPVYVHVQKNKIPMLVIIDNKYLCSLEIVLLDILLLSVPYSFHFIEPGHIGSDPDYYIGSVILAWFQSNCISTLLTNRVAHMATINQDCSGAW